MSNLVICEKCKKKEEEIVVHFPVNHEAICSECDQIYPTRSTWTCFGIFDQNHRFIWLCDDCSLDFFYARDNVYNQILLNFIQPERSKREDL